MPKPEPMTMLDKLHVGSAAAVGGIAPNVLFIAMCLTGTGEQRKNPGVNFGYLVGLSLLAGLGYLVAWFWNERVARRAFYLGMGLPAMLQIAMSNPAQQTSKTSTLTAPPGVNSIARFFSTSAFAQAPRTTPAQVPEPVVQGPRAQTVTIEFKNVPTDAQLVFINSGGELVDQIRPDWERNAKAGRVVVSVPRGATDVQVFSALARNAPEQPLTMTPGARDFRSLRLESKSDFIAGFLRALGRESSDAMKLSPVQALPR